MAWNGGQSGIMLAPVAPHGHGIGCHPEFFARQTETLVMKEKVLSLSGDSFSIKLANGTPLLKVQGSIMSLSGRKAMYNMAGGHMFDICKELLHIHATFACVKQDGTKIMEAKKKFAFLGSKAEISFNTNYEYQDPQTGQKQMVNKQENLKMKGNWFDSAAEIVDANTGAIVARIDRKLLSGKDILFGQQTYAVTVAPGVDMALMAALCICMDEMNNEGKGGLASAIF